MRKSRIRKKKKSTPMTVAKDRVWKLLKQIIEIRDEDKCISCKAEGLSGHNRHGGHFIPSAACGGFIRYDLRNVWVQCARCNLFLSGAGAEYAVELQKRFGTKFIENLLKDRQVSIKLDIHYLNQLADYYETLLSLNKKQLIALTRKYRGFYAS